MNFMSASRAGSSSSSSSSSSSLQHKSLTLYPAGEEDSDDHHMAAAAASEHMFDKVVTPSDVGKLNRLVIPKQYAEKYFPLDSSANVKGLLLNFEDRNGKPWRFRYSYWNSSQSYVITKGWSRFVKEKKLDAGDIVSFHRGAGELGKDRLFIDWRRRPAAKPPHFQALPIPQYQYPFPYRWNPVFLHQPPSREHYSHPLQPNVAVSPYHHHHHHHQLLSTPTVPNYLRSETAAASKPHAHPVVQAKQFRLFGVNMDRPISECETTSSSLPADPPQLSPNFSHRDRKGKGSMSLDLDI